ncbi:MULTISPECIES: DUF2947 domain-containing protein [Thalassolituus]|uniref:DUF2947 domain-containing protein n=1 Tax=Thalassolituus TaxID=187492 RepID=UPI000C3DEC8F|nr:MULTISPECIES: DUF2947 domain-containing protein [Thalassolituus]MAX86878.1 hypothetical protein [Oceanospirillaceae bacterium]MEC9255335.1 DUF2947 domain-containing protein [Pseudomonadota bacterium]HCG77657.1 DUF2947 domain-containing protein [Oceanospirillales bacterium]MEC9410194.1 DUF2947 domain-containing protein [Pseudomonadota bacterium]MED5441547.1 DUF2947 domain-containing protein [Pseudomonadota bacterium]|tara:strand:+ start:731 stop:1198 length:468 start_codon:yes stop_codon:yes gene_type:complete
MEYQLLSEYPQSWIFRHRELPVPQELLDDIRPLSESSALAFWRQQISKEATHAAHFMNDDWPNRNGIWHEKAEWQPRWESDDNSLPEELDFGDWENNTTVFFCYDCHNVIQTTWGTFRQCWKNFLFYDDEPLLLGRRRMQVARFHSDGTFETGVR